MQTGKLGHNIVVPDWGSFLFASIISCITQISSGSSTFGD